MRFTKGRLAGCTIDGIARRRLRLADFLLNKCFLNALARLILPLPVMVKVFLALECVLTLGITIQIWDGKGSSFYFSCKFYFKYFYPATTGFCRHIRFNMLLQTIPVDCWAFPSGCTGLLPVLHP